MTQAQMERELARATGESLSTIRSRGFSIIEPPELEPLIVDWDQLDAKRVAVFPSRNRDRRRAA